jgi:hypothetical protein
MISFYTSPVRHHRDNHWNGDDEADRLYFQFWIEADKDCRYGNGWKTSTASRLRSGRLHARQNSRQSPHYRVEAMRTERNQQWIPLAPQIDGGALFAPDNKKRTIVTD